MMEFTLCEKNSLSNTINYMDVEIELSLFQNLNI